MQHYLQRIANALHNQNTQLDSEFQLDDLAHTPVIWLLGKTGAGKSSLVRALTQSEDANVGNGFVSCTRHSQIFGFPSDHPLVKFLDTRGLGEIDYEPTEDLKLCLASSHIILVVARLDDPVQHDVARVLKDLKKRKIVLPIIVIHTGADLVPPAYAKRAQAANQQLFETAIGKSLRQITVALPSKGSSLSSQSLKYQPLNNQPLNNQPLNNQPLTQGIDLVIDEIAEQLPEIALLFLQDQMNDAEQQAFNSCRSVVIRFAGAASSCDLAPVVGAVAVPAAQSVMLKNLAQAYNAPWSKRRFGEFSAALGVAALARFSGSYVSRQLAKLIPGVGQTLGAVTAGAISFATTYALGRSAAYYLYHVQQNKPVNQERLRALYKSALAESASAFKAPTNPNNPVKGSKLPNHD